MITHWATVEADFTREYPSIDFPRDVWKMPWRRFRVLLSGLSPQSTWQRMCNAKIPGSKADRHILDAEAAERYFASIN